MSDPTNYQKTTLVQDVTILVPDVIIDANYKNEQALYFQYDTMQYTANPINSLYAFFIGSAAMNFPNMGPDFITFWREKLQKHPVVCDAVSILQLPQYQTLSDSVGSSFYFSYNDETNSISDDISTKVVFSYNPSLYSKIFSINENVPIPLQEGLIAVNSMFVDASANLPLDDIRDTISAESFSTIRDILYVFYYMQYGYLLSILPIGSQFYGSVQVTDNVYNMDVEGQVAKVDNFLNKLNAHIKWMQTKLLIS